LISKAKIMKNFYLKLFIFTLMLSFLTLSGNTQNIAVTDDETYTANPSAMLDVKSISKGLLVPRLTSSQRTAISTPATGLLVFDTDFNQFYYFNGSTWQNVSAEGIWILNTNDLFLSDNNYRVGIGTSSTNSKLEVKADASFGENDTLFVVKDNAGYPVFAVFPDGAKVFVDQTAKGKVGGFAVSGRTSTKFTQEDYFHITPDSARIYINESAKGKVGGFAVSGRTSTKESLKDYFNISAETSTEVINPSEPRVLWYPNKEAFLVGKVLVEHSDSVGQNSLATGFESKAVGDWSQALGFHSTARGDYSTAIGKNALANGINSFAFGNQTYALNDDAIAIGSGAEATGKFSFAFGSTGIDTLGNPTTNNTVASGLYSYSFGLGASSSNLGSMSFGVNSVASGEFSIAIGYLAQASGYYASAIGYKNRADGYASSAIGRSNIASGAFSFAAGLSSKTTGYAGVAIGASNFAAGTKSLAMGEGCLSDGYTSVAIGKDNQALGNNSVVFGYYNEALADESYIFGKYSGDDSKPGSFIFNTNGNKNGLAPSKPYQMNFKAENGFRFFADDDTLESVIVIFEPGGNVGIGIKNPNYKFDVDGDINITGNYYTNGAKSNFADFVFSDNYNLESIEEHAAFMWKNKHLPALKSAKELSQSNYSITERSEQMLEELEKAHIYIEQLNREIKNLENKNIYLEEKINNQQEQINQLMLEIEKINNKN